MSHQSEHQESGHRGSTSKDTVVLGHIVGAHGVKGWVRVYSHTEPREAIVEYSPWMLGEDRRAVEPLEGGRHGKAVVARLDGVDDRSKAEALAGLEIGVDRRSLPEPGPHQYYWADLIGKRVVQVGGKPLGTIDSMMATGANDVMVVKGESETLVPFILDSIVTNVDLESGTITVDWDSDY